jgi:hypothetical protein
MGGKAVMFVRTFWIAPILWAVFASYAALIAVLFGFNIYLCILPMATRM